MKPFILITGMHRSGTSFLARALNLRGVYLGKYEELVSDDWRPAIDNARGHWENQTFFEISEKTLALSNGSWHKIPESIRVNSQIGKKIKHLSKNLTENSTLASGIKDPRILICLDSWLKYLPKNLLIVGIFRNPLKVAESLKKRNGFSYEKSLAIWKIYNERLLGYLDKFDGFLLDFDWPKSKLLLQLDLLSKKIGLPTHIDLSQWYTKDLFKSDKTFQKDFPLNKEISILYDQLKKRTKKNSRISVKFRFEQKESSTTIQNLLIEIQNQNNYFKILNDQNLKKLEKGKNYILKLNQELQNKESEMLRNKEYTSKLTNNLSKKEEEIYRQKEYTSKLTNDLSNKEEEIYRNKENLTKLSKELQDQQAELTHNKEHIAKLTKGLQDKDAELSKVTNHTSKLTKDIEDKESEIKRSKDFVSRLSTQIVEKKDEIKSLENQIKGLEENIISLTENRAKYYSSRL